MSEYDENFITTYTGKKFHYLYPAPKEIDIRDIAHSLSLTCRFNGHCKVFYSVAEHSIRVSQIVPARLKLAALLHDAAEAYITDIPRPIKNAFGLRAPEALILSVILAKYDIQGISPLIRDADNVLIATESRDLMPNTDGWAELPPPLEDKIEPWASKGIECAFLELFKSYYKEVPDYGGRG